MKTLNETMTSSSTLHLQQIPAQTPTCIDIIKH